MPLKWYHLHILDCWYFSRQFWFQLVSHPAQHFMQYTLWNDILFFWCRSYISRATKYTALMLLLSNFESLLCSMSGSNCCLLSCIQLLRRQVRWSGTPVSLRIFHRCDPHSQGLLCSQWSRSRFFFFLFGIPLLFLWSSICCQFDIWFLWHWRVVMKMVDSCVEDGFKEAIWEARRHRRNCWKSIGR